MKVELHSHEKILCLKTEPFQENIQSEVPELNPAEAEEEEKSILCRNCGNQITSLRFRTFIDGKHSHIFANPYGMVFEIVCFSKADGCGAASKPSDEFSWFQNHRWRVCVCKLCLNHNGWIFESADSIFFGLIIDQLIYP